MSDDVQAAGAALNAAKTRAEALEQRLERVKADHQALVDAGLQQLLSGADDGAVSRHEVRTGNAQFAITSTEAALAAARELVEQAQADLAVAKDRAARQAESARAVELAEAVHEALGQYQAATKKLVTAIAGLGERSPEASTAASLASQAGGEITNQLNNALADVRAYAIAVKRPGEEPRIRSKDFVIERPLPRPPLPPARDSGVRYQGPAFVERVG